MPDMYAFQPSAKVVAQSDDDPASNKVTPNILPCRIHHDGPVDSVDRFWVPMTEAKDNTQSSHFRGRKLRGRRVAIPDGYQGVVATPTDRVLPAQQSQQDAEAEVVEVIPEEPVKILETQGTFDEMIVWRHEFLPAADDSYVKGVEEWIKFAETMHGTPVTPTNDSKKS